MDGEDRYQCMVVRNAGEGRKFCRTGNGAGFGDNLFPHVSTPLWYHLAEPYVSFVT